MARGPLILSVITFVLGTAGVGFALYIIIAEEKLNQLDLYSPHDTEHNQHVFNINLDTKIINIVTGMLLILSVLAIAFSVLLFIGVRKKIPGFVLAYFSYGSMLMLIIFLTGLLEFIQGYWYLGVITSLVFGIHVCCLHVVYNEYNVLQKGIVFGINGHALLINEEETISTEQI